MDLLDQEHNLEDLEQWNKLSGHQGRQALHGKYTACNSMIISFVLFKINLEFEVNYLVNTPAKSKPL